jgi:hypothetical protein
MKLRSLLVVLATAVAGSIAPSAVALPAPGPLAATASGPVPAGSYLAVVDHNAVGKHGRDSQRLVLISPTGGTTTVYERRISRKYGGFSLLDWSANGQTALLTAIMHDATQLIRVDVATGAVTELPVKLLNSAVLDPDGTGVLASTFKSRRSSTLVLDRISWAGARTRLREGINGRVTPGRNGTVITAGQKGRTQYVLSTSDGSVVAKLRGNGACNPVRWWDATQLLEWCGTRGDLFLITPATGATTRLTAKHGRGDYGHIDARQAGNRLYVQVAGPCGYTFVGRQTRSGAIKHLRVPGAVGNVVLVDAVGNDLVLEHAASCDGDRPRAELTRFDPVHHEETPLLVLGRHEAFGRILVYGEVRASTW